MKPAGQMTLTLTSELEQFVRHEVKREHSLPAANMSAISCANVTDRSVIARPSYRRSKRRSRAVSMRRPGVSFRSMKPSGACAAN